MDESVVLGQVHEVLVAEKAPLKAAEICERLAHKGIQIDRRELNPILYRNESTGPFQRDAEYRWSLREPSRSPANPKPAAQLIGQAAKASPVPSPPANSTSDASTQTREREQVTERKPDKAQEQVIQAEVAARIVVEAGPGYGKTDVACARVARLIGLVDPTEILLLSFTRTAVLEMRTRIKQLAQSVGRVDHVGIRTLDSFNAELRRTCTTAPLGGNYEQTIKDVVSVLESPKHPLHPQAIEALRRYKHILVDEAQDLVGVRSRLLALVLRHSEAGWTVFFDPAQAIYGWAETGEKEGSGFGTVLEEAKAQKQTWTTVELKNIYRTSNKKLKALQTSLREVVLRGKQKSRADAVRKMLADVATPTTKHELIAKLCELPSHEANRTLVLYRTRGEALQLSHDLAEAGVKHRLRLGRLPQVVAPWVAACLNATAKPKVTESEFAGLWDEVARTSPSLVTGWEVERAWRALLKASMSGKTIETGKVADAIAFRLRTEELFNRDIGPGGPIVGTIHGSKGREAQLVTAHFSSEGWEKEDADEEARVLYVGVTRAKDEVQIVKTDPPYIGLVDGRAWKSLDSTTFLFEVGQPDDVDAVTTCGALSLATANAQQQAITSYNGEMIPIWAKAQKLGSDWKWLLLPNAKDKKSGDRVGRAKLDPEMPLAALSPRVPESLLELAREKKKARSTKGFLFGLYWYDTTTVAVRDDHPALGQVPSIPWRKSRLWLAPVVMGFGLGHLKNS